MGPYDAAYYSAGQQSFRILRDDYSASYGPIAADIILLKNADIILF